MGRGRELKADSGSDCDQDKLHVRRDTSEEKQPSRIPWHQQERLFKKESHARQWWRTPLIPALGRQRQEDFWVQGQPGLQSEFQDIQGYTEKPCLKTNKQANKKKKKKEKKRKVPLLNMKTRHYRGTAQRLGELALPSPALTPGDSPVAWSPVQGGLMAFGTFQVCKGACMPCTWGSEDLL
jgi:hypothetical protein